MTAPDPSLDELASAHLDGATTAEEAARVQADPRLRARVEELAAVRRAVATPVPPLGDDEREALLARALGAALAPPEVVALRHRRLASPRILAVAAALLAVAFLGGALALVDADDDGADDSAATMSLDEAPHEQRRSEDAGGGPGEMYGSAEAPPERASDLGAFPDLEALGARIAGLPAAEAAEAGTTVAPGSDGDDAWGVACTRPGATMYTAQLDGRSVVVALERTVATVLDAVDCHVIAELSR